MPDKTFLETYPLYKTLSIQLSNTVDNLKKPRISLDCPQCGSVQTFGMANEYWDGLSYSNFPSENLTLHARYVCLSCTRQDTDFIIRIGKNSGEVQKVGQFPAWDIKGDKNIEKMLGNHKNYMRRGQICESQGYGIAAFAYYRRITEEIIDALIADIGDLIPSAERSAYDAAYENVKNTRQTSDKIALVKDLLPASLTVDGMNPLGILHRSLSEGLHAESDHRCIELAEAVRETLAFLASQVAESKAQKRNFSDKMRKLLGN